MVFREVEERSTLVKAEHPSSAQLSMDVKEAGNSTLVKAEHPLNAQLPMDVKEVEERSTLAKAEQSEYLYIILYQLITC